MSSEKRQPWMKFFPSDWRADPCLRMCGLSARGLWMEMLALMHEGQPYGHMTVNGRPVTERQLAQLAGTSPAEVGDLLSELEEAGVFSRDADGVIFSRRMVRDADKAAQDKANGGKGGNPKLKARDDVPDMDTVKQGVNPPLKAHMPEARDQKEEAGASSAGGAGAPALTLITTTEERPEEDMAEIWNAECGDLLPRVRKIDQTRRNVMRRRWKDDFGSDIEAWRAHCRGIRGSPFCTGQNDRGWKADIDFALTPKAIRKTAEGAYDHGERPDHHQRTGASPHDALLAGFGQAVGRRSAR